MVCIHLWWGQRLDYCPHEVDGLPGTQKRGWEMGHHPPEVLR
jgi:hypothetical protein